MLLALVAACIVAPEDVSEFRDEAVSLQCEARDAYLVAHPDEEEDNGGCDEVAMAGLVDATVEPNGACAYHQPTGTECLSALATVAPEDAWEWAWPDPCYDVCHGG